MSDESVDIKVNLTGVTSDVEAKLASFGEKAKKGINVPISGKNQGSFSQSAINKPVQSARAYTNKRDGLVGNTQESIYSGKNQGARAASMMQSDLDEGARGGFYNSLNSKIDSMKGFIKSPNQGKEFNNQHFPPIKDTQSKESSSSVTSGGKYDRAEFTIQNADFKKIGNAKKNSFGAGNFAGGGGSGGGMFSGGENSGRGSILSKVGMGIPILGGVLAAATAGIMKLVSDVGQRHVQAIMSQSSTLGATGGYMGTQGNGYFANAEVAQANIARGRISGESVFGKGNQIDNEEMKFAASQGRGLSEIAESMARLKKENSQGLNYYRGVANQAGFKNLRQSEFLTKVGDMSESLRHKGYSGNMESMLQSIAGMKLGENSDPLRKFSIAESIGEKSRNGIFGGGVTGALAMSEALKESGGDFNKAMMLLEGKGGDKYGMTGIQNLDESTRGFLFKKEGIGTFTEGYKGKFEQGEIQEDNSEIKAGFNTPLSYQNKINETFAGSAGADAAKIGFEMTTQMLDMYKTLSPTISTLSQTIHELEKSTLSGINSTLAVIAPTLEKLAKGDIDGILDPLVAKLKSSINIFGD